MTDLLSLLVELSRWIVAWAPIFAAVAAVIAVYKFFIQKPAVVLKAESEAASSTIPFDVVRATPTLFISNEGRAFADDVYLEMETLDWSFGRENDKVSTFLDVNSEQTGYIGSPRRQYQISANKPIQPKDDYKAFLGGATFERGNCYELEYTVSCRSHGPRTGSIEFHAGYKDVNIVHNYPKCRRKYLMWIRNQLHRENTTGPELDLLEYELEWQSEQSGTITALMKNNGSARARTANIEWDVFIGDNRAENYYTSSSSGVLGLDTGEFWRVVGSIQLDGPYTNEDVTIDCQVNAQSNHLVDGWQGVKLIEYEADLPSNSNNTTRVRGRLENLNAETDRNVHVVVKFVDDDDIVLFSEDTRLKLSGGEEDDFGVHPSVSREMKDSISDCHIVLMG